MLFDFFLAQAEGGGKQKSAALAGLTFHPNLPAHQVHQSLADGQAQAGAAEFPGGGGIGLGKGLKEVAYLFLGKADAGVPYREFQGHRLLVLVDHLSGDHDLPGLGKLDGVVGQIDEHLPQPQGIAHQKARHVLSRSKQHLQVLFFLGFH